MTDIATLLQQGATHRLAVHELAHADDIRRRFTGRAVTVANSQILLFGLTAGLIPCPAAITVLLLCLQLKQLSLGAALVLRFSIGLALTLVLSGTVARWRCAMQARPGPASVRSRARRRTSRAG